MNKRKKSKDSFTEANISGLVLYMVFRLVGNRLCASVSLLGSPVYFLMVTGICFLIWQTLFTLVALNEVQLVIFLYSYWIFLPLFILFLFSRYELSSTKWKRNRRHSFTVLVEIILPVFSIFLSKHTEWCGFSMMHSDEFDLVHVT